MELSSGPSFVLFWGPTDLVFSRVCQCVLQALTALKLALLSLLEWRNLSGERQKVRAGPGIELYLAACWGRIRSGAGENENRAMFEPN